jgi:hypothetical protein
MAHHHETVENLSHDEIMYRYYTTRGSEFTKIDLFLSARNHYAVALQYKPGDALCMQKMQECTEQIQKDRVKVLIITPLLLALIAAVIYLNM